MSSNYYSYELWLIVCIIPLGLGEEASGRGVGASEIGPANQFPTCKWTHNKGKKMQSYLGQLRPLKCEL